MMGSMCKTWFSLLLIVSSLGCASTQPAPASALGVSSSASRCAQPAHEHQLEVSLSIGQGSERKPLCPGERLSSNDALFIAVESAADAYVRLIFVSADGHASEWPPQEHEDVTRKAFFRAPAGVLAKAAGEAQLFLVASLQPLSETDPVMQGMLDVIRDTAPLASQADVPAPGSAEVLHVESHGGLEADFDENGLAMLAIGLHAAP